MFLITQFVCPLSLQIPQNNYSYKCILYANINLSSIKFTQVIKLTLHANSSVQFSQSVMSDSLWPHGLQHARPPCPSPTPRVYSNSCPLTQWCLSTISFSIAPFSPSSIFPSIRVFSNESGLHIRLRKYWSFSFSIGPSNEHPGLISFRMNLLDLLAVQGTLKSLLQHHNSKASILQRSAFFIVQFSHPYMITAKTIALTIWTFADVSAF